MINRYSLPDMQKIWTDEERLKKMFEIELVACEALARKGIIPEASYKNIKEKAKIDTVKILEIEKVVKHDVIAFLEQLQEQIGEDAKYIHLGLTSSDVLDTATALQLRESCRLIIEKLGKLSLELKKIAVKYKKTPIIGRTHGVHAEPTTFGLKALSWYSESERNIKLMLNAVNTVSYGKISGAVGNFAHIDPDVEEFICGRFGIKPEPVSTQVIPRDRHAVYIEALGIIASSLERIVTEVRHLQKNEVAELSEPFTRGQKGSSAMPHKRNPIMSENICGLARLVRAYVQTALENIALWHERDISHSSAERIILPDASILVDFMLGRVTGIVSGMEVNEKNMQRNLELTKGLVFSERVLLSLIKKGMLRKKAYELVQECAFEASGRNLELKTVLLGNGKVKEYLSRDEIENCFNLNTFFSNVDYIYDRTLEV